MLKTTNQRFLPYWLRWLIIILLIIGVCFRFSNLGKKVYWKDEVLTSLHIAGYRPIEVVQEAYDGKIREVREFYKYLHPTSDKTLADTIRVLAVDDSQHSPLYYVMTRFWSQVFGSSPKAIRALSALISLLTFPCFYWLCFELFESTATGWIVMALTSVSLFHLMYAQEAREYSLWIVTTLISSAVFLKAIRSGTKVNWGLYAITIALSLYTYFLTIFVMLGHGIYILITERFRINKTLIYYLLASLGGLVLFSPWILTIITYFESVNTENNWYIMSIPYEQFIKQWILNISYLFVSAQPRVYLPILALIAYSFYYLCSRTPQRTWLFVLTMMGSLAIPLITADLVIGMRVSLTNRYLVPVHLGIQLAVAYFLADQLIINPPFSTRQKIVRFIGLTSIFILIGIGFWTCSRFLQTESGWNKGESQDLPISRIINKSTNPLVISNIDVCPFLSLVSLLKPEVKVQLLEKLNDLETNQNFSDIFLFDPTLELVNLVQEKYKAKVKPVYQGHLYKVQ